MPDYKEKYERAMQQLIDKINYLSENAMISDKSAGDYEGIINSVIDYVNDLELKENKYLRQISDAARKYILNDEYRQRQIEKLEAICFIHGIYDLKHLMTLSREYLISEAMHNDAEGRYKVPDKFRKPLQFNEYKNLTKSITQILNGKSENKKTTSKEE